MRVLRRLVVALLAVSLVGMVPPVAAQPGGATVSHHVVASFDGTPLQVTLLLPPGTTADAPAPLVLRTHGWGGRRETGGGSSGLDPGADTLERLLDEGYAVLTWDQRGFGCSGGQVRIDDPDVEGRDVTALIDWALAHAPIATDAGGDPVVGMSGGSYAGGIQTAAAAVDPRIDALAPEYSWSDLRYSLYSGRVVNQAWATLLYSVGTGSGTLVGLDPLCDAGPSADALDPAIHQAVAEFVTTGAISAESQAFLAKSSLASYGRQRPITVPTLVLQGSVDTLFDLTDGLGIYTHVRDQGVAARFVVFCGGHVACPASYATAGDRAYLDDAIVAWFARHLRGEDVPTGAPVSYRTNEGVWRDAAEFAAPDRIELSGAATGMPVVPVVDLPEGQELLALVAAGPPEGLPALPITAAQAAQPGDPRAASFPVARASAGPLEVRGIPEVAITVSGVRVPLDQALEPLGAIAATLPTDAVGGTLVGSLGLLGSVAGGSLAGGGGGDVTAAAGDGSVHVFVKLVHREAGEVLNVQEGAVRVALSDGVSTVDVPMPGVAYTIPAGDHLDLEVSTASLMHATGRTPALIDVAVASRVPVSAPPGGAVVPDDAAEPDQVGSPAGAAGPRTGQEQPLPASGAGPPIALVVAALLAAAATARLSYCLAAGYRDGGRERGGDGRQGGAGGAGSGAGV